MLARSRLRSQGVPGSKPDSTKELPCKRVWCTLNPSGRNVLQLYREDFISITIKNLQMRTTYADGTGYLKKQDVCAKGKLAEGVERIRHMYERNPQKSKYKDSRELQMPQKTVCRVLRKRLKMKPYVIQLVPQLKQEDYGKHELRYVYAGKHGG
ncbi:hypothetical protein AVEN_177699-1 [Araneus ventricosus]|uniref:Uncharacterized protein n=1 Tax=Araneus ventricosus TaxID=182803 RepID=A0A4Y2QS83_ARAVE|nr:hypothetical protein AVEN_177699-1 [Araneus ventricosus]